MRGYEIGNNPVGQYMRTFDLPDEMEGERLVLRFEGVETAFRLFLNGVFVGYSEDSFSPSEHDGVREACASDEANEEPDSSMYDA